MQFSELQEGRRFKSARFSGDPRILILFEKIGNESIKQDYIPRGLGFIMEITAEGNARRIPDGLLFNIPLDEEVHPLNQ